VNHGRQLLRVSFAPENRHGVEVTGRVPCRKHDDRDPLVSEGVHSWQIGRSKNDRGNSKVLQQASGTRGVFGDDDADAVGGQRLMRAAREIAAYVQNRQNGAARAERVHRNISCRPIRQEECLRAIAENQGKWALAVTAEAGKSMPKGVTNRKIRSLLVALELA